MELVKDAIKEATLDAASVLLKTLDDPLDKNQEMIKLCRTNWKHGVKIITIITSSNVLRITQVKI